jgi:hypothetical protein
LAKQGAARLSGASANAIAPKANPQNEPIARNVFLIRRLFEIHRLGVSSVRIVVIA